LIVTPGNAAIASILTASAQRAGVAATVLAPATENDLRRRLAEGGIDLVYFAGRGKVRAAAGHATLDFESSTGPAPRSVNLVPLAAMLAAPGGPGLVVTQPLDAQSDFRGMAAALVQGGVRGAIVWPAASAMPLLGDTVRRMFERWTAGAALADVATTPGVGSAVEYAGLLGPALEDVAAAPAVAAPVAGSAASVSPLSPSAPPTAAAPRESEIQARLAAKRAAGRFDVFMCHNSADKPAVRAIARSLKERGILPWLDEWELPPGQPWQPLLERQIESIRSAAVCVGRAGVGPWQEQELYGFLREFVARRAPVIPLLLPDAPMAPELPVFLRAMTYVDFRQHELDPMDRLEWGITGVRPAYD